MKKPFTLPPTEYEVSNINQQHPDTLIEEVEQSYRAQVLQIVQNVLSGTKQTKFILVSGPSSSGKTTTSHILQEKLLKNNINAKVISLDDFFLERHQTPYLPNGDRDYDSVNSIDWQLFDKCMRELLKNKSSVLPVYDFIKGTKHFNNLPTTLMENEIIILEGLHALNPVINHFIPHKYSIKVYVFPKSNFKTDSGFSLDSFNLRLMRRLIRDIRTRGISPENTLKFWVNVREAEDLYVIPFEKDADFIIDTTHAYEPCVYKSILKVLLVNHRNHVQELLKLLEEFNEITPINVPAYSLLKEFVG